MAEVAARVGAIIAALTFLAGAAPMSPGPRPFANWAAVVVAGDHEDSDGNSSEGFDNARRDIARHLLMLGFLPQNIAQFSLRPHEYRGENLQMTEPNAIMDALDRLAGQARAGCLLYITSHGEEDGLIVGAYVMPPRALADVVIRACSARPTVIIISACFSGAMLPPLKGPNRMILTAARRDRTSFGCGQSDRYPYFDQCVLEVWNRAADFADLAARARACVAAREMRENLTPPSHPQFFIGRQALASLPQWH